MRASASASASASAPVPVPMPVPARRPRAAPAATVAQPARPRNASVPRSRRATSCRTTLPPPFVGSRRFRTSGRVFLPPLDRDDHEICPSSLQSEKRTQRPNLVAIAKPPLRCGFAGPRTVLQRPRSAWRLRRPWRCRSRPLLRPAIRGHLARASAHQLTTSRVPRDEALRNSATPTQRSEWRMTTGVELIPNVDIHLTKVTTTCCGTDLPASTVKSPGLESHTTTVIDSFRDTCFKLLGHNRDTCRVFSLWGQHYILWSP